MENRGELPTACGLQAGDYQNRLAWIAELARDGLLGLRRTDLQLELRYASSVADRVREMVGKEQECCAFLKFELSETDEGMRLTITAPERALFEQFAPAPARDRHDGSTVAP